MFDQALTLMSQTGALQARAAEPSLDLVQMRETVTRLVMSWDDNLAKSIAADNLFLDRSIDRRSREVAALRERVGSCSLGAGFAHVENALRGRWIIPCERGSVLASITLAPVIPVRVQYSDFSMAPASGAVTRPAICAAP